MKFESTFWLEQTIEALSFGSDSSLRGAIVEAEPDLHQADPHRIDHQMELLKIGRYSAFIGLQAQRRLPICPSTNLPPGIKNRLHSLLIGVGQRTAETLATGTSARMA